MKVPSDWDERLPAEIAKRDEPPWACYPGQWVSVNCVTLANVGGSV